MDQSLSPISDSRNESAEVSRRLYRCLMETARQLDDHRSYAKTTRDLFTVQAEVLRIKLREYAERLIFSNTLGQGRKIEEVLWRKGLYDDACAAKRLRKAHQWLPEEKSQLQIHLTSGVGFYHHLLLCFQADFGLSCAGCVDFPVVDRENTKNKVLSSTQLESARESVHRCLVCLGDISRYLMDISPTWHNGMAIRYYHQALSWNPEFGKPHNQLGTLAANINYNLDAVYHFIRCLMCSQPFEGAEGNLNRNLERNAQRLSEDATNSVSAVWRCQCSEPGAGQLSESQDKIQQLISHFLLLMDVWFNDKKPVYNISELCHQTLLDFHQCLGLIELSDFDSEGDCRVFMSPKQQENFPSHLSKDIVFKMVVLTLACLCKLRKKGSAQASSVVAFLLAVFSLMVEHVLEHLKDSVFNISLPISEEMQKDQPVLKVNGIQCPAPSETEVIGSINGSAIEKKNGHIENELNTSNANGKPIENDRKTKKLKRISRRRPRRCNSEDSDHSENEDELNAPLSTSDISEDEEVFLDLSSDDDNDEDIILEESVEVIEGLDAKSVSNGHVKLRKGSAKRSRSLSQCKPADPMDILEQVCGEGLLPAIKVCSDWLLGDTAVVQEVGRDSCTMLHNFAELVSIVNIDVKKLEEAPDAKFILQLLSVVETGQNLPLPEDVLLQKLPILDKAHEKLEWEAIRYNHLNPKEEALLRVRKLVQFGHYLEEVLGTGFKYNEETRIFCVCSPSKTNAVAPAVLAESKPSVDLERRGQLMHNMGQLWLRAEVQNLEYSVKRGSKGASYSPYLVLDVDALTKYFHLVGQLMTIRRFIMIVPSVVLTALDQMKRESVLARDAIRWLEFQFQKGSRFLRAQTAVEALHLPLISYPKPKAREAWNYFKILECCHYLNQHSNNVRRGSDSETGLVTLLTGHDWSESSDFSPVGVAKAVGITLEHIESFCLKWKTSSKSHG